MLSLPFVLSASDIRETVSWQSHSWNDLREWPQLFAKGVSAIKVDVHFVPREYCHRSEDSEPRGCLILNHDRPHCDRTLFTPDDILSFLSHSAHSDWISRSASANGGHGLLIDLCLKNAPVTCVAGQEYDDWVYLVGEMVSSANRITNSLAFPVEFAFDGKHATAVYECSVGLWEPWVSTYVQERDPPEIMFDGSDDVTFKRMQILNNPWKEYVETVEMNYGKFINSTYPWLAWEPSNQDEIEFTAALYVDKGISHSPGFRFAINCDPVMFSLYSSPVTSTATSITDHKAAIAYASKPSVAVLGEDIVMVYRQSGRWNWKAFDKSGRLDGSWHGVVRLVSDGVSKCVLFDESGKYRLFEHSRIVGEGVLKEAVYSFIKNGTGVVSVSRENSCHDGYVVRLLSWGVALIETSSYCVPGHGFKDRSVAAGMLDEASVGIVVSGEYGGKLRYGLWKVEDGEITSIVYAGRVFGVGVGARMDIIPHPVEPIIVALHGNGFCWNTQGHNMARHISLCDRKPVSQSQVMVYDYGYWSSWVAHGNDTALEITACSRSGVLHGVYDLGRHPSLATMTLGNGELAIVSAHEGFSGGKDHFCGRPDVFHGIVLDTWVLPSSLSTHSTMSSWEIPEHERSWFGLCDAATLNAFIVIQGIFVVALMVRAVTWFEEFCTRDRLGFEKFSERRLSEFDDFLD